jgi:ketosteroid isomerase-like protein
MKNAKELMLEYTASSNESGEHSRKEKLTNNVNEKNKQLVLDAKTLLLEFLAAITHGQDAAALFAEDGAVELPFLHSVGIPWRHRGRRAISELQGSLAGLYLDFAFKPEDTRVLIDTPEQVFAEYMAHTTAAATGRTIHHLFAARLVAENGRIKLLRESLNPVAVAQALLPGGVKDLPDPERVIFSVPPDYRS